MLNNVQTAPSLHEEAQQRRMENRCGEKCKGLAAGLAQESASSPNTGALPAPEISNREITVFNVWKKPWRSAYVSNRFGCHNKMLETGQLTNNRPLLPTVPEARSQGFSSQGICVGDLCVSLGGRLGKGSLWASTSKGTNLRPFTTLSPPRHKHRAMAV